MSSPLSEYSFLLYVRFMLLLQVHCILFAVIIWHFLVTRSDIYNWYIWPLPVVIRMVGATIIANKLSVSLLDNSKKRSSRLMFEETSLSQEYVYCKTYRRSIFLDFSPFSVFYLIDFTKIIIIGKGFLQIEK